MDIGRGDVRRLVAQSAQLVEVLPSEQYAEEHLPGAINLPLETLTRAMTARVLAHDRPVIVYCQDTQ